MTDRGAVPPFLERGAQASFEKAQVAILPVPYAATVTWVGGAADGPAAILRASDHLEVYDEQLECEPFRCGIWTDSMLEIGDEPGEPVVERIHARFDQLLDAGKWVVMLGGEHSITPAGVRAAAARHAGLEVVQLDAHADLRSSYHGSRWNHACAMARCLEYAPVRAVGVRSYSTDEAKRIAAGIDGYRITHAWEINRGDWIDWALEGLEGKPVYLTFDVDYFDPGFFPATGTPEPGGGAWWPTLEFLSRLFAVASVVACDVVELAPTPGLHHCDFTAARLVYKLIAMAFPQERLGG